MSSRPTFATYDGEKVQNPEGLAALSPDELQEISENRRRTYEALVAWLPQLVEYVPASPVEVYGRSRYSGYDELLRVEKGWPVGIVHVQHRESAVRVSHLMTVPFVVTETGFFGIARMSPRGDAYVLNDPQELTEDNVVNYQRVPGGDVEPSWIVPPSEYVAQNIAKLLSEAGVEYTPPTPA